MRKAAIHLSHQNLRKAVLQMQARIMLSQRYTAAGNAYTCDRYGFIFVFIMTLTATLVAYIT